MRSGDKAVGANGAIDRVSKSLDAKKENLADQLEKIEEREDIYKKRLEKQYGALETKLAAFKATQTLSRTADQALDEPG